MLRAAPATYLWVLSLLSSALACCSLMMVAFTCGGFMCTFSFPPTSSRTVAANLVCVFRTCGGCFSMMKVLWGHRGHGGHAGWLAAGQGRTGGRQGGARQQGHLVTRAEMISVMVALTSASISSTGPGMGSCWHRCSALRICCRFCQMSSASFSHLQGPDRDHGFPVPSDPGPGPMTLGRRRQGLGPYRPHLPCPCMAPAAQHGPGLTRTAARPGCPQGDPHSLPAAAAASTGSARRPG